MQLVTGDIEAQIRRVFENLKAVAEAAGGSLAQAVKMNVYLTDLQALRQGERDHGPVLLAALPGTRGGRRGAAAAGRRGRDRVHPAPRLKAAPAAASPAEQRPVTVLRGVGAALAERLARLHVTQSRGPAVRAAAALRGPHPRGADRRTHAGHARGGRGGGAAHRSRLPRAPPAAVPHLRRLGDADAAILLLLRQPAATISPAARACAASARCAADPSAWRSCIRSTAGSATRPHPLKRR